MTLRTRTKKAAKLDRVGVFNRWPAITHVVERVTGVRISLGFDRLDEPELVELAGLVEAINQARVVEAQTQPKGLPLGTVTNADARSFLEKVKQTKSRVPATSSASHRELDLLAARTKATDRPVPPSEHAVIREAVKAGVSTLADVKGLPTLPQVPASDGLRPPSADCLSGRQKERLEALVEKAAGRPAGWFREQRAAAQARRIAEDALKKPATVGRHLAEPGTVTFDGFAIMRMLWDDLDLERAQKNETTKRELEEGGTVVGRLELADLAWLVVFTAALETQRLPSRLSVLGVDARFDEAGAVTWINHFVPPQTDWGTSGAIRHRLGDSLAALARHGWLSYELVGGRHRVTKGRRLLEMDAARGVA